MLSFSSINVATRPGFSGVPRWVVFPCQNFLLKPLMYPTALFLYSKPGFQQRDPYPNTQRALSFSLLFLASILKTKSGRVARASVRPSCPMINYSNYSIRSTCLIEFPVSLVSIPFLSKGYKNSCAMLLCIFAYSLIVTRALKYLSVIETGISSNWRTDWRIQLVLLLKLTDANNSWCPYLSRLSLSQMRNE